MQWTVLTLVGVSVCWIWRASDEMEAPAHSFQSRQWERSSCVLTASQRPTDVLLWEGELQRDNQTPPGAINLKTLPRHSQRTPCKGQNLQVYFIFYQMIQIWKTSNSPQHCAPAVNKRALFSEQQFCSLFNLTCMFKKQINNRNIKHVRKKLQRVVRISKHSNFIHLLLHVRNTHGITILHVNWFF